MRIHQFKEVHRAPMVPLLGLIAAGVLFGVTAGRADEPPRPEAARVPVREGQVQANGITIAYESFGPEDRETVLMVMGNVRPAHRVARRAHARSW